MNNLVVITHKNTGEQRTFSGEVSLKSNDRIVSVRRLILGGSVFVESFDRKMYFADIEELDDEDLL